MIRENRRSMGAGPIGFLESQPMLVHVHGRCHAYDNIDYSQATYKELTRTAPYQYLLKRAFSQYAVLAFGFGFTDPPFLALRRRWGQPDRLA